jgi:hypothetical protein
MSSRPTIGVILRAVLAAAAVEGCAGNSHTRAAATDASFASDSSASGSDAGPAPDATAGAGPDATDGQRSDAGTRTAAQSIGPSGSLVGAASSDGSAMLIVIRGAETGMPGILWSHYEPGSGWSAAAPLPGALPRDATTTLGMDGSGNAFAVWDVDQSDAAQGYWTYAVGRYDHARHAWSPPVYPDSSGKPLGPFPALSVNSSGEALIVDPFDPARAMGPVYAQHYSGGSNGSWTQETVLTAADYYSGPLVYLTDSGLAVAAIQDGRGLNLSTRAGTTWTKAPVAGNPPLSFTSFGLTANAAGDVLAGGDYGGATGTTQPAVYQYDATKQAWSGPTLLSTETQPAVGTPRCPNGLSLTGGGDAVLARCGYGMGGTGPTTIEAYTYSKSSGTWNAVQNAGVPGFALGTTLAFDSSGVGFAAYVNSGTAAGTTGPFEINPFTIGTGWGPQSAPQNPDAGQSGSPQYGVAFIAPNGAGWAAWSDGQNTFVREVL